MKMISGLFTFFAFLLVTGITNGEECSTDRLKRCRYVVSEELQRRSNGLSHQELQFHCKAIRQNLDCIVYQVTMCNSYDDRDSNSDIIWRSWKYLQSVCDTFGGWWQSRCFQRDDVKQCERLFTIEGNSLSRASCTNYLRFRDCVIDVVKRRCDPEESQVLSSYLLDKAQEMVWRCPGTSQISLSFDSAARLSESSSLTGCNARASTEVKGCLDRYQYQRDEAQGWRDSEERLRRSCCAAWNYKRCVRETVKNYCFEARESDVTSIMDRVSLDQEYLCRDHWIYTCNSATIKSIDRICLIILLSLTSIISYLR